MAEETNEPLITEDTTRTLINYLFILIGTIYLIGFIEKQYSGSWFFEVNRRQRDPVTWFIILLCFSSVIACYYVSNWTKIVEDESANKEWSAIFAINMIPIWMYIYTYTILLSVFCFSFAYSPKGDGSATDNQLLSLFLLLLFLMLNQYYLHFLYKTCETGLKRSPRAKAINETTTVIFFLTIFILIVGVIIFGMKGTWSNISVSWKIAFGIFFVLLPGFIGGYHISESDNPHKVYTMINKRLECEEDNKKLTFEGECQLDNSPAAATASQTQVTTDTTSNSAAAPQR